MLRSRKQTEPDEPLGAPEWMVTFSDCMTLLLTFFVLLLSFSSFDEAAFERLKAIFAEAMPTVSQQGEQSKDAFLATQQIQHAQNISEGSEKPTLETGKQDHLKQESEPIDFRSRKVFLISSEKIFWGKGTAISLGGREALATIASFLKQIPSRVVISENGPAPHSASGGWQPQSAKGRLGMAPASSTDHPQDFSELSRVAALESDTQIGLLRAWAVVEYLVKKQHLDKNWFSISAASTLPEQRKERVLEIVLLERSIYH